MSNQLNMGNLHYWAVIFRPLVYCGPKPKTVPLNLNK